MTPPLIRHIEDHLGPILGGLSDGSKQPLQIVHCNHAPVAGMRVLVTLGLSFTPLYIDAGKHLRQELVLMFREVDGPRNLPAIVQDLALEARTKTQAFGLGDVVGPRGPLTEGATVSAFYIAQPGYLPESFAVFTPTVPSEPPIVFAWLVPITESEAAFVLANGRDAFEDELERIDPDLLDFHRAGVV